MPAPLPNVTPYPLRPDEFRILRDGEMSEVRSLRDTCIGAFLVALAAIASQLSTLEWDSAMKQGRHPLFWTGLLFVITATAFIVAVITQMLTIHMRKRSAYSRQIDSLETYFCIAPIQHGFLPRLRGIFTRTPANSAAQLNALEAGLTKRITDQEQDVKVRTRYQFDFAQGLAAGAADRHADASAAFRRAVKQYKAGKARQLIPMKAGATALTNIFVYLRNEDQANFVENAKKELADEFYNDLGDELALAAVKLNWLAPLVKERKAAAPPAAG